MANTEHFNISKAYGLQDFYRKSRKVSKQKLVEYLIMWHFLCNKSIIGASISVPCYFRKSTVESVLNDFGYNLDFFSTTIQRGLYGVTYGKDTNFSFSVPEV